jgi:hypothetical protein
MTHSIHVGPPATSRIRDAVPNIIPFVAGEPAPAVAVAWLPADAIATA